jgi:hypothetical protein
LSAVLPLLDRRGQVQQQQGLGRQVVPFYPTKYAFCFLNTLAADLVAWLEFALQF